MTTCITGDGNAEQVHHLTSVALAGGKRDRLPIEPVLKKSVTVSASRATSLAATRHDAQRVDSAHLHAAGPALVARVPSLPLRR